MYIYMIYYIMYIYTHDTDIYILVGGVDRCALVTHNKIVNLTVRFIILTFWPTFWPASLGLY